MKFPNYGKTQDTQRGYFTAQLYEEMLKNDKIWLVIGDLGFGAFDKLRKDFPSRVINVGAAEQTMLGVGVGLALQGKIPFCYSITPFLLFRPVEVIRNYIDKEKIPVKLIGNGRNGDYSHDGFSHWSFDDAKLMCLFDNIDSRWPTDVSLVADLVKEMVKTPKPYYLNLAK